MMKNLRKYVIAALVITMSISVIITAFAEADKLCEFEEAVRSGYRHSAILQMFPDTDKEDLQVAFEQEVIRLVNEIRYEYGLFPLTYHPELAEIARMRARETIVYNARGTHVSPVNGLQHGAYARAMGLNTPFAGENAGWRATPEIQVYRWMASPAHRGFILNRDCDLIYIGVGFYFGEGAFDTAFTLWRMVAPE